MLQNKPKREYRLEGSIFNYAIYAMIHPKVIKQWEKRPDAYACATGVILSQNERESVFQGAVTLVFIQTIMIGLVIQELYESTPIVVANEFKILIPRIIACFFMHANLQGEIKSGLRTMKYVVYHPFSFRTFDPDYYE